MVDRGGDSDTRSFESRALARMSETDGAERRSGQEGRHVRRRGIVLTVDGVMRRRGGIAKKEICISSAPMSLPHFVKGTPSVVRDMNAVEE